MNDFSPSRDNKEKTRLGLPPLGEAVWVQCDDYRTMAFRDENGKWLNFCDGRELQGKIVMIDKS